MYPHLERQQQRTADRLKSLPTEVHPPYGWAEFQRRAQERRAAIRQGVHWGLGTVAASLLIIVTGIVLLSRGGIAGGARTDPTTAVRSPLLPEPLAGVDAHTRDAERWLATLPPEPAVVRFGTRMAVTQLEDRIAQMDDLLSMTSTNQVTVARRDALLQERGRLVKSLAQVRYAETLAADLR